MREALLFKSGEKILVTAEEVKSGKYGLNCEFVDPEYEFKVNYVKGAKNNGGPYFRFYYSLEDYKRMFPERAGKYQMVKDQRRYDETVWHKKWKDLFKDTCKIEKYIKNEKTNRYKYADAYNKSTNTVIELQHSYIDDEFEERNKFYSEMGIRTVWLFDLTKSKIISVEDGYYELLENNSNGFFRISENPVNLKVCPVFIQTNTNTIYRIGELKRRETSTSLKSTIRYFKPLAVYTEQEFVSAVCSGSIFSNPDTSGVDDENKTVEKNDKLINAETKKPIHSQEKISVLIEERHEQSIPPISKVPKQEQILIRKENNNNKKTMFQILCERSKLEKEIGKEKMYDLGYNEVKDKFTQQEKPIKDSFGNRWVKCTLCGRIGREDEFGIYGGSHTVNLGKCNKCY